jgi:hypothetical protein
MRELETRDPQSFALLERSAVNHCAHLDAVDRPAPLRMALARVLLGDVGASGGRAPVADRRVTARE